MVQLTRKPILVEGYADPADVVRIARTWIGTPYVHQAHKKSVGCDCIGLIVGVWSDLFDNKIPHTFKLPPYTPHWGDETGQDLMTEYSRQYLQLSLSEEPQIGDVCLWRMLRKGPVKHAGIVTGKDSMIHAYYGHDVMETAMVKNVGAQMMHRFSFPRQWTEL